MGTAHIAGEVCRRWEPTLAADGTIVSTCPILKGEYLQVDLIYRVTYSAEY